MITIARIITSKKDIVHLQKQRIEEYNININSAFYLFVCLFVSEVLAGLPIDFWQQKSVLYA